mgnify:CR=1 FL=1
MIKVFREISLSKGWAYKRVLEWRKVQILVIEYALGGFSQGKLVDEILLEGYAMLRALIEDLKFPNCVGF